MRLPRLVTSSLVLLVGLLTFQPARALDNELNAAADAVLAEHFDGEGPGAAVAVLVGGEVVIETAIGYADIEQELPIDSQTVFDLASVSKQFTAAAILKLVDDRALDVRRPVSMYIPDFEVRSPRRQVRVADLIFHISGLADYTGEDWQGSDEEFAELTTESHLDWLNDTQAHDAPGTSYSYNNSGYALLALIVERVSGQAFGKFARARLFQPAGMKNTRVLDRPGLVFRNQATGYKANDDGEFEISSSPSIITGDGNVFSNLADMIAWMRALDGNRIFNPAQKRLIFSSGKLDSGQPIEDEGTGYGYGWVIESNGRVSHSGSWMGTATYLLRDQPAATSVIVLSNDENADVAGIAEALIALTE